MITNDISQVNSEEDPLVQYYIIRKDINMSIGKVCAQVAHASQIFMANYQDMVEDGFELYSDSSFYDEYNDTIKWLNTGFRKVMLGGKLKDFEKIKKELFVFVVRDAGLTEVESGTETVLATYPIRKSLQPKILSRLQLYGH